MRRVLLFLTALVLAIPAPAQTPAKPVGKVDRMVPAGFIHRGSSTTEAKQTDPVEWNDILRTNDQGRMRVAMEDGSMLSIGAKSELRVVKHDPESNQTLVEMLYGKARANVVPIRKNGGSFQIRTPTAVIGVLGTTVDLETVSPVATISGEVLENLPASRRNVSDLINLLPGAMPDKQEPDKPTIADFPLVDSTIVRSLDHVVGVRSIDPDILKTVFVLPGQYTIVRRGMPPTDPQFGDPPTQPGQSTPQTGSTTTPGGCPSFIDPRRFDDYFTGAQRPSYEIIGKNSSTGQVFEIHVKNPTNCPLNVQVPAGTILQPTGYVGRLVKGILLGDHMPPLNEFQTMAAEGGFLEAPTFQGMSNPRFNFFVPPETDEVVGTLRGYCLDLHKLVPSSKTKYKFADAGDQQRLAGPALKIMETANKMFFTGQSNPPNASLDSLVQWSMWASREGIKDGKKFEEEYVGLVKRNHEGQKKKFDKKTKEQVSDIARGFWPYVQKVLAAAQ
jgi:hypothetical protein